jgi:hypothetical protein
VLRHRGSKAGKGVDCLWGRLASESRGGEGWFLHARVERREMKTQSPGTLCSGGCLVGHAARAEESMGE